jgi:hypothetical protein
LKERVGQSPQGALWIPNDFTTEEALGDWDCFFDTLAQGLNWLSVSGGPVYIKSLSKPV